MEVSVHALDSRLEGCIMAVRVGDVWKQAELAAGARLYFSSTGNDRLKVEVFKKVSTGYLLPRQGTTSYKVALRAKDSQSATTTCQFAMWQDDAPYGTASDADPEHSTLSSERYLERHSLAEYFQTVLGTIMKERPQQPHEEIAKYFLSGHETYEGYMSAQKKCEMHGGQWNTKAAIKVSLIAHDGSLAGHVLSLRAHECRKQVTVDDSQTLSFPSPMRRLTVEALKPLYACYIHLKPGNDKYRLRFPSDDGGAPFNIKLTTAFRAAELGVAQLFGISDDELAKKKSDEERSRARAYLENNAVVETFEEALDLVLKQRPKDPYATVAQHFQRRAARVQPHPASADVAQRAACSGEVTATSKKGICVLNSSPAQSSLQQTCLTGRFGESQHDITADAAYATRNAGSLDEGLRALELAAINRLGCASEVDESVAESALSPIAVGYDPSCNNTNADDFDCQQLGQSSPNAPAAQVIQGGGAEFGNEHDARAGHFEGQQPEQPNDTPPAFSVSRGARADVGKAMPRATDFTDGDRVEVDVHRPAECSKLDTTAPESIAWSSDEEDDELSCPNRIGKNELPPQAGSPCMQESIRVVEVAALKLAQLDFRHNGLIDKDDLVAVMTAIDPSWTESGIRAAALAAGALHNDCVYYNRFLGWAFSALAAES